MEQFKDIERENKTKPHSKQGLLIEDKLDPKLKEKNDALEWISVSASQSTPYWRAEHGAEAR